MQFKLKTDFSTITRLSSVMGYFKIICLNTSTQCKAYIPTIKLTHPEIHDLLIDLGVSKYEDTDSLSHEIKRMDLRTIKSIEQTTNKITKKIRSKI